MAEGDDGGPRQLSNPEKIVSAAPAAVSRSPGHLGVLRRPRGAKYHLSSNYLTPEKFLLPNKCLLVPG